MKDDFAEIKDTDEQSFDDLLPDDMSALTEGDGADGKAAKKRKLRKEKPPREKAPPKEKKPNPLAPVWQKASRVVGKGTLFNLVFTLTAITVVVAATLGVVHGMTKDTIAANNRKKTDAALSQVFPGQTPSFELLDGHEDVYAAKDASGRPIGYAVLTEPAGYAGPIRLLVGVNGEGRVEGVTIISHRESRGFDSTGNFNYPDGTPYTDTFAGKTGPFSVGGNLDAVSGATISSKAIARGVSDATALARTLPPINTFPADSREEDAE